MRFTSRMFFPLIVLLFTAASWATPRSIDPIVSTDWLEQNLDSPNLVILDIRSAELYQSSHIPGAINEPWAVPVSAWITLKDTLLLELPADEALFTTIGNLGITTDSQVVVISATAASEPPHFGLAAATRVADTLIYAGVTDVAVLDGGFDKWQIEEKAVSTTEEIPVAIEFNGQPDADMFVSQAYVKQNLWRVKLIDARDANIYFGDATEPYAPKPGHIFSASSLPAPWAYYLDNGSYLFKDTDTLKAMTKGVVGPFARHREVIVYCGVGGYASVWWYLLHEVLGYERVKFYDGSAQEWVLENEMTAYRWQ